MVVTRFAPSPTGYLHVGGARTALFCWLLARHYSGRMILRIEDTDQKRNTPTAMRQVIEDLRWLGIDWDEGPEVGGPNGPYLQSERLEIYNQFARKLIESGHAYYCFDTQEELQLRRDEAADQKKTFAYRKPAHVPTENEVAQARAEGRSVTIRFAVPQDQPIVVNDIVRGVVTFDSAEISDFIIIKSDGFPTYHFACVVDDELMEITHVVRGQEHLMNTPGHVVLQQALGFRTPIYAHMSVTVSEGGGKLSKRDRAKTLLKTIAAQPNLDLKALAQASRISDQEMQAFLAGESSPDGPNITAMAEFMGIALPEINVVDFFKSGYLPEAMVNFLALLGWSPGQDREVMTREELTAAFNIDRFNKTNSLFDRQKLVAFNTEHMRMVSPDRLLHHFKAYLKFVDSPVARADDATLAYMLKVNEGARTLAQIEQKCRFAFIDKIEFDPEAVKKVLLKGDAAKILQQIRDLLAALPQWEDAPLNKALEDFCTSNNLGVGKVAQPIRVAITGSTISPPIHDSLILLGRQRTLERIDHTLDYLKKGAS